MSTLLMRLAGPLQSWGTQSRFSVRDTGREPSKSGVIGLLCAALGKPRDEGVRGRWPTLSELASLRMGVRVEREGALLTDYHTAGGVHRVGEVYGVYKADGSKPGTVTSSRQYLADAEFLVGLEGDRNLLLQIDAALRQPVWQIFLGRKSFVPSVPVRLPDAPPMGPGLRDESLDDLLCTYPYAPALGFPNPMPERLRIVRDTRPGSTPELRQDVPVGFGTREFVTRNIETAWIPTPAPPRSDEPCSSHD